MVTPKTGCHLYDPDLRLHYNRFRDYDPFLGRYLQPDPIGCAGGINLYAYPANPLVIVDVLGLAHSGRDNDPFFDVDEDGAPISDLPPELAAYVGDDGHGFTIRGEPTQVEINAAAGAARETEAVGQLMADHPDATLETQRTLLDADGQPVQGPDTFEERRLDIVVIEEGDDGPRGRADGRGTSETADKGPQLAKEERIRDEGGTFIRTESGDLVEVPMSEVMRLP